MENWTLTWTKLVPLNKENIEALRDSVPGIYRISCKESDGNIYVVYVGQSIDIKKRLSDHLSAETNESLKYRINTKECFFRYSQITKDYIRSAAEKQMYKHYQPPCNDKEPEGRDDVKVNLT